MSRILIVDDDYDIVDSLSIILEANDFEVEAKMDTEDLSTYVADYNPDLIILDIMFPEDAQGGFAAARELSKSERLRHIPILLLSAVNQRSNMSFAFSDADISDDFMPVNAFIEKPVEPKLLLARIQELLHPPATG